MERARSRETGIFRNPADIFKESKLSHVVLGKAKSVEESNPEYEKLKNYISQLEDHPAKVHKHVYRCVKRYKELGQSLSDFGKGMKLLGNCEGNSLEKAFSDLGSRTEDLSMLHIEGAHLLMNFQETLKDYILAVQSIKTTLTERANMYKLHRALAETVKFKEIDINELRFIESEKLAEVEGEYEELKASSEDATRRFETMVKVMNEEIIRFEEEKTGDMGVAFNKLAKGLAKLANDIAQAWQSLLPNNY